MYNRILGVTFFCSIIVASCSTNPVTERRQLTAIPDFILLDLSKGAYEDFKEQEKAKILSESHPTYVRVKRITDKVIASVEQYLTETGNDKRLKSMDWEVVVVDDTILNAFCMPGGKIAFYTKLVDLATDDELSFVAGHEIAHAIAKHSNEMMSQSLSLALAGSVLYSILTKDNGERDTVYFDDEDQYAYEGDNFSYSSYAVDANGKDTVIDNQDESANQANGGGTDFLGVVISVASYLGELAFSRNHETEADKMGLIFMYKAGYDIHSSVNFWKKMSAEYEKMGVSTPAFLSTHPSDKKRIENLEQWILEMETNGGNLN